MFVHAKPLDIHVKISGKENAPALLLLHSLGTNLHLWDAQAEALSDRFRVIQPDMRGHGLTSVPPGPYSIDGMPSDIDALLSALAVNDAHVAGISLGGTVLLSLAARSPARVRSLILCDTARSYPPADFWRERARTARTGGLEPMVEPAIARWVSPDFRASPAAAGLRAMLRRTDPEGYAGAVEALADCMLDAETAALRVPALVLVGEADLSTPIETSQRLRDMLPGSALKILPKLAHLPLMEAPGVVTDVMIDFLVGLDARGRIP